MSSSEHKESDLAEVNVSEAELKKKLKYRPILWIMGLHALPMKKVCCSFGRPVYSLHFVNLFLNISTTLFKFVC